MGPFSLFFCNNCPLDQGAPEAAKGGADILVSSLGLPAVPKPMLIDAENSGDEPEESTEILKEWVSAIDQRCGSSASVSDLSETTGSTAGGRETAPGPTAEHQGRVPDVNEPDELFIDPSNQRVIAVFPDKKRKALGALSFLDILIWCFFLLRGGSR